MWPEASAGISAAQPKTTAAAARLRLLLRACRASMPITRAGSLAIGSWLGDRDLAGEAGLRRDQDRALARGVGLLAVIDHVHAQRLLVLAAAQRHHQPHQLQQRVGAEEGVERSGERGQSLVAELRRVAVEEAVR